MFGGRGNDGRSPDNGSSASNSDQTSSSAPSRPNPVLEEYRRRNPGANSTPEQQGASMQAGDLSASSVFEDERRTQVQINQEDATKSAGDDSGPGGGKARDPSNLTRVLDPNPNARERFERKRVIQAIRRGGRLNREQFRKRTEREHTSKSHNMKTSVKKLGMLARQIAGKTVDEAIAQMRFSKKKVAIEVMKQLELARDEAVTMRGMGLGAVSVDDDRATHLKDASARVSGMAPTAAATGTAKAKAGTALQIQLKDGKRHTVSDASTMYVDQAWVGRGPFGRLPDYRARGQVNYMRTPWTSLTVMLKEEKTRVREYEEREEKRRKQIKLWTQLPDRPVQWQRQWYGF